MSEQVSPKFTTVEPGKEAFERAFAQMVERYGAVLAPESTR